MGKTLTDPHLDNNTSSQGSHELPLAVVEGLQERKAVEIRLLDLRKFKNAITDSFVICSGTSDTHIEALRDSVEKVVNDKLNLRPWKSEGSGAGGWVLLDYVDVVVHIFQRERRQFYGLEDLWGDADITEFEA